MGRGRKPSVDTLKIAAGTDRAIKAPVEIPEPPDCLDTEARIEWDRVTVELFTLGLIARVDRAALTLYACAWSEWLRATAEIADTGHIILAPTGFPCLSPWLSVRNNAAKTIHSFLSEFGLSPAARMRLTEQKAPKKAKSKWEGLLGG